MWLLDIFPDIFFHILLIVGGIGVIAGFLLTFIPFIGAYRLPIQIISVLILSIALWFQGGIAKNAELKIKIAEFNRELAEARAASNSANTKIVIKYVEKIKTIKEKGEVIETIIYKDPDISNFECKLPNSALKVHNAAATGDISQLTDLSKNIETGINITPKMKLAPKND